MIDKIKDFIYHSRRRPMYYRKKYYLVEEYFIFNIKIREIRATRPMVMYPMYNTYMPKSLRRKMKILDKNMDKILSKLI